MGVTDTVVSDRIRGKASTLAAHFKKRQTRMRVTPAMPRSDAFRKAVARARLFVNATPVGMWPWTQELPIEPERFDKRTTVFDLVPKPIRTGLIRRAESLGLKTIPGIRMLVAQALEADALYLGRAIPDSLYESVERVVTAVVEEPIRA
jgi:shikimate dehydrogenase